MLDVCGLLPKGPLGEGPASSGRLLIIAHDDFTADLSAYAAHKTGLGWLVDLADTTTAGTSTTDIQSYVQSRYADPATWPDALLLVGDTDRIPCFVGAADNADTDLYYACMDGGDDWYPEFPVGRFSVASSSQLADVIDKTIEYETAPFSPWMTQAAFIAGRWNYTVSEGTHDWVISNYMDPLGYTSEKLYAVSYGAVTYDVRDALNAGSVFAIYSGHGSSTSWNDRPPFWQSDVRELLNEGMYPFLASFACATGDYSLDECFAETWLRVPDKGAVAVWASSVTSSWAEDDILEKKLFEAIYDHDSVAIGTATLRAKQLYLDQFGPTDDTRCYFEMYNLLGDPTVEIAGLATRIASPSQLPMAYPGEAYEFILSAGGGNEPYDWSVTAGQLPDGLILDSTTGVISGTPESAGIETFTIRATDATLIADSREFTLPVVTRLQTTTPAHLPDSSLGEPYQVLLQAEGGSAPYRWSLTGGQYEESDPGAGYLGGGVPRDWHGDDATWQLTLPWSFRFYDCQYDSVYVCSNGFLDFASISTSYENSASELKSNVRIAPLWDDLRTDGDGEDVFVTQTDDYAVIRWAASTGAGGNPVDVEVVLYRDGGIRFNYGQAHFGLSPTIGLSAGDNSNFCLSSRDGASAIPANVASRFDVGPLLPAGLSLDENTGEIRGTPEQAGQFSFTVRVQDAGVPQQVDTREFNLQVAAGLPKIGVTDSSTAPDDSTIQFTTALSQIRLGVEDSPLVRPACPDVGQYIDVANIGILPLTLFEIQTHAPNVTVAPQISDDPADDLVLARGETQRFQLSYAPSLPSLADPTPEDFAVANGLVILSDAANAPTFQVSLYGASTFNSDINYDGKVDLGDLEVLDASFGWTSGDADFDPTADINGDGAVNLGELGPLNVEFGRELSPAPLCAECNFAEVVHEKTFGSSGGAPLQQPEAKALMMSTFDAVPQTAGSFVEPGLVERVLTLMRDLAPVYDYLLTGGFGGVARRGRADRGPSFVRPMPAEPSDPGDFPYRPLYETVRAPAGASSHDDPCAYDAALSDLFADRQDPLGGLAEGRHMRFHGQPLSLGTSMPGLTADSAIAVSSIEARVVMPSKIWLDPYFTRCQTP